MNHQLKDIPLLRKILWADFLAGSTTAIPGLLWYHPLCSFLGLPAQQFLFIAAITLVYAIFAFLLTRQQQPAVTGVRLLVSANWLWVIISIVLLITDLEEATVYGKIFLILQPLVVGGLAYLEERHIIKIKKG